MKCSKNNLFLAVASTIIIVASIVVMLLDLFIPLNFWVHPFLNFVFCLFTGFGILFLIKGIMNKSVFNFFVAVVIVGFALFYALINILTSELWWVALLITLSVWLVSAVWSLVFFGNRTEKIALNSSPDYKNYKERKSEKEKLEKVEEEEIPKLKSFKN